MVRLGRALDKIEDNEKEELLRKLDTEEKATRRKSKCDSLCKSSMCTMLGGTPIKKRVTRIRTNKKSNNGKTNKKRVPKIKSKTKKAYKK
jgi:hypothetical protein